MPCKGGGLVEEVAGGKERGGSSSSWNGPAQGKSG